MASTVLMYYNVRQISSRNRIEMLDKVVRSTVLKC